MTRCTRYIQNVRVGNSKQAYLQATYEVTNTTTKSRAVTGCPKAGLRQQQKPNLQYLSKVCAVRRTVTAQKLNEDLSKSTGDRCGPTSHVLIGSSPFLRRIAVGFGIIE